MVRESLYNKASRTVPYSTLHDRINGKTKLETTRSGPDPLLSQEEEQTLVTHIELMSSFGYGYTRTEVTALVTDLAIHLGKRKKLDRPLSLQWIYSFMKPRSLEIMRAKATSLETVNKYFNELEHILKKYNLKDRPQAIYNIDEKGIVENHTPPCIVSSRQEVPPAVTMGKSSTVSQSSFLPGTVFTSSTDNCPENISATSSTSVMTAEKADDTPDRCTNFFRKAEAVLTENTKQTKKRKVLNEGFHKIVANIILNK